VNNHPSTFALSFDPKSVPNTSFILYEIAVLFTAIAVFYTAQPSKVNNSFQIFAPNIDYMLTIMSDNREVKLPFGSAMVDAHLLSNQPNHRSNRGDGLRLAGASIS
jgi:hypothetical protein